MAGDPKPASENERARALLEQQLIEAAKLLGIDSTMMTGDAADLQSVLQALKYDPATRYITIRGHRPLSDSELSEAGLVALQDLHPHAGDPATFLTVWNPDGGIQQGFNGSLIEKPHITPVMVEGLCVTNIGERTISLFQTTGGVPSGEPGFYPGRMVNIGDIGVNEPPSDLGLVPPAEMRVIDVSIAPTARLILPNTYRPLQ